MTAWIFTFGAGQRLRSTNRAGRADFEWNGQPVGEGFRLDNRYVRIEEEHDQARATMDAIFGQVWSMEYIEGPGTDEMIARFGLVELDITEPIGAPPGVLLGLASTRLLLEEIRARGDSSALVEAGGDMAERVAYLLNTLPTSMLDYRTVDAPAATP